MIKKPPKWALSLLNSFCHADYLDEIQGDLEEMYQLRLKRMSPFRANLYFLSEVIGSFKTYVISGDKNSYPSNNQTIMIRNYLTIAFRNLNKNQLYTGINILGLAVGITCSVLILLFVINELNYDLFHADSERMYRISETFTDNEGNIVENSAAVPWSVGPTISSDYSDVLVTRMYQAWQKDPLMVERDGDNRFYEDNIFFVDSTFFDMFSFELLRGDRETVLDNPQSLVITEETAQRYFGDEDPIGKTIWLENALPLTVTGVAADVVPNSHFHFDFLVPLLNIGDIFEATGNTWDWVGWYWNPVHTYVKLPERYTAQGFNEELAGFVLKHFPEAFSANIKLELQWLADIHFTTNLYQEIEPNRSKDSVYIAAAIAIFILIIAIINFINITTASATKRAKEVALRKVMGSTRSNLMMQFYGESILLCFFGLVVALIFLSILIGPFEQLVGAELNRAYLWNVEMITIMLSSVLIVGILAGTYPALVLSGFNTVGVLKANKSTNSPASRLLRKLLVIFQFSVSIVLLISAMVIYQQHQFLITKQLGFDQEQIVMIPIQGTSIKEDPQAFKIELNKANAVLASCALSDIVGQDVPNRPFRIKGYEEAQNLPGLFTDHDFVKTFNVNLIGGRDFTTASESDRTSFLINEKMLEMLKDEDWEGQGIGWGRGSRPIIGMVEDFNFMDLRQEIRPLFIGFSDGFLGYVAVRVKEGDVFSTVKSLEDVWNKFEPDKPFVPFFLNEKLNESYESERQAGELVTYFSGLAMFIAFLGLIGLVTYAVNTRVREIGIRKVLGASSTTIVNLISAEFIILVIIATIIAWPLSWYIMDAWLQDFTYRIDIPYLWFVIAGIFALGFAYVTTVVRSLHAAQTNPVDTIRED